MARFMALLLLFAVCGAASAAQPPAGRRHLTQADPFTVFNEPAAPATVASGAPSVNINGVGAAAGSATTVPVMGTLAAPLQPVPGATYAAGYAPVAVGGVSVASPTDAAYGYAPAAAPVAYGYAPAPGYAPAAYAPAAAPAYAPAAYAPAAAPAMPAYDPIAAAAGIGAAAAPVAAPVAAAPAPAPAPKPSPPPARPPPPMPPGMMPRSQMKEQIPANASALPTIKVPEGTTAKIAYVCDISGTLYIAVNHDSLIMCPTDNLVQLAKLSGIKGAKSVTCPDNRLACPGNYAVNIVVKLNNTLEEFQAVVPQWRANVATAASVRIDRVVITDVEVLYKTAAPAPAPAAVDVAPAAAAPKPAAAPKVSAATKVQSRLAPLRRLMQVEDTAAVVTTTKSRKSTGPVEDTVAKVDVIEKPKPKIIVTTTIQPLTEMEAMSVYGTTKSSYFDTTFTTGSAAMGMKFIDGYTTEQGDPSDEYEFPSADADTPKLKGNKKAANATDLDATDLTAVALTPEELAAQAEKEKADAAALAANATAAGNATTGASAKSAAGAPAAPAAFAKAAVAALCVLAVLL